MNVPQHFQIEEERSFELLARYHAAILISLSKEEAHSEKGIDILENKDLIFTPALSFNEAIFTALTFGAEVGYLMGDGSSCLNNLTRSWYLKYIEMAKEQGIALTRSNYNNIITWMLATIKEEERQRAEEETEQVG
jgi:hypothetical protein